MSAMVVIKDANGDHLLTVGPFEDAEAARKYCKDRESKRGEWYLEVRSAQITPVGLDWEPGEDVYKALERMSL